MHYLNDEEKKIVTYSNRHAFPPRPLTDIEKTLARIMFVRDIPSDTPGDVVAKMDETYLLVDKLKELTANNRLADKVKAALASPDTFDEFTEGYPYAKYNYVINGNREQSTLVRLGMAGFSQPQIDQLMRWVAQLALAFYAGLPKGVDTFIWTPHTRHYQTHNMAKATGDKAFYGYALPKEEQALINTLFGDQASDSRPGGNLWAMHHVRLYGIHKSPEVWARLGWGDMAKEVFNTGLEINFGYDHTPVTSVSTAPYWFLELRQERTNSRIRFIVEG